MWPFLNNEYTMDEPFFCHASSYLYRNIKPFQQKADAKTYTPSSSSI